MRLRSPTGCSFVSICAPLIVIAFRCAMLPHDGDTATTASLRSKNMPSKDREIQYAEALRARLPELGPAEIKASEELDVLLHVGPRAIGLEITEYSPVHTPGFPIAMEQAALRRSVL